MRALPQPATVRLQGLATLLAAFARRALAGFVSHQQRSWDSPFGAFPSRKVPAALRDWCTHVPFLPSLFPSPERWAGPTGRGFWALTLPRVPGDRTGFNSPTAGCSLGFCPPRVSRPRPCPGFHPRSSHALHARSHSDHVRRRPGVSIGSRLALSNATGKPTTLQRTTLPGFSRLYDPGHSRR